MFGIMLQKLWHKKWMNLCLLLGSVLLIATVVSFPLYQAAAYNSMLQDEFVNYLTTEGKWPTMNEAVFLSQKEKGGKTIARIEELMGGLGSSFGVTERENIYFYALMLAPLKSEFKRDDATNLMIRLAGLSNLPEHATMLSGEMYSDTGLTEDGRIEVVVNQATMVNMKLLMGETLTFDSMKDADGNPVRIYIKGVYEPAAQPDDFFWQPKFQNLNDAVLMNMDLFRSMFSGENAGNYSLNCYFCSLFEYRDLKASQAAGLAAATDDLTEKSAFRGAVDRPVYRDILESYLAKEERIKATLTILQVPVLIMLGAFLFMISGQMYDMERNEISVIKSRGSSGGQIFRLYLYQCFVITLAAGVLGLPLGMLFSRILGSARSFLQFDNTRALTPTVTRDVWIYAACAIGGVLLIMTLPAIKHSRVTIVKLKQQKAMKKRSLWEKLFLDVILLGVSLYGYYSFHRNSSQLGESVMQGESLDPLLYFSSSLFIVGLGLLFLRLQPYLVQLIYMIGKNKWKPASYASFMENAKNGRKQQFIMLFLIITISLGMYHATVARTILQNAYRNTEYMNATDIIVREVWLPITNEKNMYTGKYVEPDYSKYAGMDFAKGYTKVVLEPGASMTDSSGTVQMVTLMGIHTKEFGNITWVDQELNQKHYYEYLNELAADADGILVSENFRSRLGYKVGDKITYEFDTNDGFKRKASGKIIDFFSYWPGYAPTVTELNPDGTAATRDNLMVVAHYSLLKQNIGVTPYQVWIGLKEGHDSSEAGKWFGEKNVRLTKYVDKSEQIKNAVEDPLLQGTNGILTMGFIVTILLCAVGYLIYWILSIRSREMIFGVLRACGMHKGELIHMLMNEQLFSGVFSVAAGIGIGKLASDMFVPIIQQAYAAANQVLPMHLVVEVSDMVRLYSVIAAVMVICLLVLILLIFKLNVTKALKLGEE